MQKMCTLCCYILYSPIWMLHAETCFLLEQVNIWCIFNECKLHCPPKTRFSLVLWDDKNVHMYFKGVFHFQQKSRSLQWAVMRLVLKIASGRRKHLEVICFFMARYNCRFPKQRMFCMENDQKLQILRLLPSISKVDWWVSSFLL